MRVLISAKKRVMDDEPKAQVISDLTSEVRKSNDESIKRKI